MPCVYTRPLMRERSLSVRYLRRCRMFRHRSINQLDIELSRFYVCEPPELATIVAAVFFAQEIILVSSQVYWFRRSLQSSGWHYRSSEGNQRPEAMKSPVPATCRHRREIISTLAHPRAPCGPSAPCRTPCQLPWLVKMVHSSSVGPKVSTEEALRGRCEALSSSPHRSPLF